MRDDHAAMAFAEIATPIMEVNVMTAFQKELIDELKNYVLEYTDMAAHLKRRIDDLIAVLGDEKATQGYKELAINSEAKYRQDWLSANDIFQKLRNEQETWKMLITSFEDEES